MASSILRLNSCLRRISIPENHVRRILCSAGMSTVTGGGDVAPPWLMLPPSSVEGGNTAYSMYSPSQGKVVRLEQETKSPYPHHNDNTKMVGSSHGWRTLFNERDLFLWNPVTLENIKLPLIDNVSSPIKDVSKVTLSYECFAMITYDGGCKMAHCYPGRSTDWTPFYNDSNLSNPRDAKVVGSSHGWLALFNERDRKFFLWNPVTHENLKLLDNYYNPLTHVSKVILSSPPEEEGCLALMAFSSARGGAREKLAYCRPGRSTDWTVSCHDINHFPDFVYSSRYKQFFCLGLGEKEGKLGFHIVTLSNYRRYGTMTTCDRYSFTESPIGRERKYGDDELRRRRYVVYAEYSDQLYVVTRLLGYRDDDTHTYKTVGFHVNMVSLENGRGGKSVCYVESLDGVVIFVGLNHSFAVPAAELKPGSIYFADDDGVGIFDYENKTVSPCYDPVDRLHGIPVMYLYSDLIYKYNI